ncbi:MAG: hypothetical protein RSE98_04745 [Anaerovoracaceae bacterium]
MKIEKISEKTIMKGLQDTEYFETLSESDKLSVLVLDIIKNGSVKKANLECWEKIGDEKNNISEEHRFDEITRVIETKAPSKTLKVLMSTGLLEFCLPHCFPIKKRLSWRDLDLIISRFDKVKGETAVRLAILLFPFQLEKTRETLENANFDPEVIDIMVNSLKDLEDFTLIRQKEHLKKFIFEHGSEEYNFIVSLTEEIATALDFPEYRHMSKRYLMDEIKRLKEPIYVEDLAITKEDIVENGIVTADEADELLKMLVPFVHFKPYENKKEILIKRAKSLHKNPVKRAFRNVNWMK